MEIHQKGLNLLRIRSQCPRRMSEQLNEMLFFEAKEAKMLHIHRHFVKPKVTQRGLDRGSQGESVGRLRSQKTHVAVHCLKEIFGIEAEYKVIGDLGQESSPTARLDAIVLLVCENDVTQSVRRPTESITRWTLFGRRGDEKSTKRRQGGSPS